MGVLLKKEQIIASVILFTCAGIAIFVLFFSQGPGRFPQKSVQPFAEEQYEDMDADYDGLIDEEEARTLTNPGNPDTDGDDYMDGEEVALGTDPLDRTNFPRDTSLNSLIAGEQDAPYSDQFIGTLLNDVSENDRLYITESTSTDEVQFKLGYKPEDIEQVASTLTDAFLQNPEIAKIRQLEDAELVVSNDNSAEAVGIYIKGLFAIVSEKNAVSDIQEFLSGIGDGVAAGNGSLAPELKTLAETQIIPALSLMEKNLRTLPVPSSWKEMHKDEIAIITAQRLAISYITDTKNDPLRPFYGLAMLVSVGDDWDAWKEKAIEMLKG
ncbi:MAG: hypothetical protein Q7S09_05775 [bacterium]|nr:hypothetical protein [bacterium]